MERFPGESFLLESVEGPQKVSRYSFICVPTISVFLPRGDIVQADSEKMETADSFNALRDRFKSFNRGASEISPFPGGMVGCASYGIIEYLERMEGPEGSDDCAPDLYSCSHSISCASTT